MTDQRSQPKPQIAPIPAPKKFQPQVYVQEVGADPFSVGRLVQALRQESGSATSNAALVAPELSRRKEPLESMPLDSMKMVGSLNKGGHLVAIVRVDNLLYQVKPGHYLGPNYGRITKVSETEIVLREIVQDAAGEDVYKRQRVGLFRGQIHVARNLHGDGGRTLAFQTPHVGQSRADDAQVVNATVLVEARVLYGQHRIFHDLRKVGDRRQASSFLTELAHERAFRGVNAVSYTHLFPERTDQAG